mmetsp:Transcript_85892/g.171911  ORF Transcript_85892/g.171911 Transcript_85892/m.171911 type:complete len:221 (-) Transcript_85892:278-940(-)
MRVGGLWGAGSSLAGGVELPGAPASLGGEHGLDELGFGGGVRLLAHHGHEVERDVPLRGTRHRVLVVARARGRISGVNPFRRVPGAHASLSVEVVQFPLVVAKLVNDFFVHLTLLVSTPTPSSCCCCVRVVVYVVRVVVVGVALLELHPPGLVFHHIVRGVAQRVPLQAPTGADGGGGGVVHLAAVQMLLVSQMTFYFQPITDLRQSKNLLVGCQMPHYT